MKTAYWAILHLGLIVVSFGMLILKIPIRVLKTIGDALISELVYLDIDVCEDCKEEHKK